MQSDQPFLISIDFTLTNDWWLWFVGRRGKQFQIHNFGSPFCSILQTKNLLTWIKFSAETWCVSQASNLVFDSDELNGFVFKQQIIGLICAIWKVYKVLCNSFYNCMGNSARAEFVWLSHLYELRRRIHVKLELNTNNFI